MVLFKTWQQILASHAGRVAVQVPALDQTMSFADLQKALDLEPPLNAGKLHVVRAVDGVVPFIIQTLRAWRDEAVLCPVETEAPVFSTATAFPTDVVHLKFTSGTTSSAKAVLFKAEQLAADAEKIRQSMALDSTYANVAIVSVAHSYGFSSLILPLLLQGHALIVAADVLPASLKKVWEAHSGQGVTVPAVPAMWRAWFRSGILKDAPIKLAISAGAPLPLELERQIHDETAIKVHNFLGSSECGGIAYDASPDPRTDAAFVGTAMHGVNLSVNNDGCLVAEGPSVAVGYLQKSAENAGVLSQGKFTTSDLAEITDDGQVRLLGRASDTINLAGRKLDPAEVEAALLKHADVLHCVVFGVPSKDASRCEETVACVKVTKLLTAVDLSRWIAAELPSWKRPRHYWFTDELAPNERGKFPRPKWREYWLKQHKIDFTVAC